MKKENIQLAARWSIGVPALIALVFFLLYGLRYLLFAVALFGAFLTPLWPNFDNPYGIRGTVMALPEHPDEKITIEQQKHFDFEVSGLTFSYAGSYSELLSGNTKETRYINIDVKRGDEIGAEGSVVWYVIPFMVTDSLNKEGELTYMGLFSRDGTKTAEFHNALLVGNYVTLTYIHNQDSWSEFGEKGHADSVTITPDGELVTSYNGTGYAAYEASKGIDMSGLKYKPYPEVSPLPLLVYKRDGDHLLEVERVSSDTGGKPAPAP